MKYGETLGQRSIPAWQTHNIDYEEIKHFIKENTTPGKGKAISIPGTGDETAKGFEDSLYSILDEQHDRISSFVKSKAGEINRRLGHLDQQIHKVASVQGVPLQIVSGAVSAKRLERYSWMETDILRLGDDIKALARFIGVQRTAFRKLLKKYKKWTGFEDLGYKFEREVSDRPSSFTKTDLRPLVGQYDELLHAVRTLYEKRISDPPVPERKSSFLNRRKEDPRLDPSEIKKVVESGTLVDFDHLLTTLPIGPDGNNASYWVHPDNIIELQVLLLNYTHSFSPIRRSSSFATGTGSPLSSSPGTREAWISQRDTSLVVADNQARYLVQQSSRTLDSNEVRRGGCLQNALLHVRSSNGDDAAIVSAKLQRDLKAHEPRQLLIKRKCVQLLLDRDPTFSPQKAGLASVSFADAQSDSVTAIENLSKWLHNHRDVSPLVTITTKRARFFDQSTDGAGVLLASLDASVEMKQGISMDIGPAKGTDSPTGSMFPHAVLRVRQEGLHGNSLIQVLDNSYLVERVRGFSLEYHAIWDVCQPKGIAPPFWLPLLEQDIRKIPHQPTKRDARRTEAGIDSQVTTPQFSTSASSETANAVDSTTLVETSQSSGPTRQDHLKTSPSKALGRKRRQRSFPHEQGQPKQYWSEYDHPEDSDDADAYVLYIDPNYESSLDRLWIKLKQAFKKRLSPEQQPLLSGHDLEAGYEDDTLSSDDEIVVPKRRKSSAFGTGIRRSISKTDDFLALIDEPQLRWLPKMTITCIVSSIIILTVAFLLAATGRRRLASEVDAGIIFAVVSSLAFAITAVASLYRHRDSVRWAGWNITFAVLAADAIASGGLLAWIIT